MIHRFRVYGTVRGQGRPRTRKNGHVYKDNKDRQWEDKIKAAYINSNGVHFGSKPVIMAAMIHRAMPESRPKYRESEMDIYKPDVDNICKAICDSLNGIAYEDDKQVIAAFPIKLPRVRMDGEYIDVIISDEINMADMIMRVEGMFNGNDNNKGRRS